MMAKEHAVLIKVTDTYVAGVDVDGWCCHLLSWLRDGWLATAARDRASVSPLGDTPAPFTQHNTHGFPRQVPRHDVITANLQELTFVLV